MEPRRGMVLSIGKSVTEESDQPSTYRSGILGGARFRVRKLSIHFLNGWAGKSLRTGLSLSVASGSFSVSFGGCRSLSVSSSLYSIIPKIQLVWGPGTSSEGVTGANKPAPAISSQKQQHLRLGLASWFGSRDGRCAKRRRAQTGNSAFVSFRNRFSA